VVLAATAGVFVPGVVATVGGVACEVLAHSEDLSLLRLRTPTYADVCAINACPGYVPLRVENPRAVLAGALSPRAHADVVWVEPRAAHAAYEETGLLAVQAASGIVLAQPPSEPRADLPPDVWPGGVIQCPPECPGAAGSQGAFMSVKCQGFLDEPALCLQREFARLCGIGSLGVCRACPTGAYCPGGDRRWP
jgi:hypothetical protein